MIPHSQRTPFHILPLWDCSKCEGWSGCTHYDDRRPADPLRLKEIYPERSRWLNRYGVIFESFFEDWVGWTNIWRLNGGLMDLDATVVKEGNQSARATAQQVDSVATAIRDFSTWPDLTYIGWYWRTDTDFDEDWKWMTPLRLWTDWSTMYPDDVLRMQVGRAPGEKYVGLEWGYPSKDWFRADVSWLIDTWYFTVIKIQRANLGFPNGEYVLWHDGVPVGSVTGIDNSAAPFSNLHLGLGENGANRNETLWRNWMDYLRVDDAQMLQPLLVVDPGQTVNCLGVLSVKGLPIPNMDVAIQRFNGAAWVQEEVAVTLGDGSYFGSLVAPSTAGAHKYRPYFQGGSFMGDSPPPP